MSRFDGRTGVLPLQPTKLKQLQRQQGVWREFFAERRCAELTGFARIGAPG